MKKRKSTKYLVIGNAHLGMDDDILKSFATVAEHYNAQVIHVGYLSTPEEIRMHDRRINKLRTFEKIANEQENKLEKAIDKAKNLANQEKLMNKLDLVFNKNEKMIANMEKEVEVLKNAQTSRMQKLKSIFPNIKYVCNDEQYIIKPKGRLGDEYKLSRHISIESVPANGDKTSSQPISPRAFRYLKQKKRSIIMPHPSPALQSYNREGINHAWNMYTTGCLFNPDNPKRSSEYYKNNYLPSAMLVLIDSQNGEFHASRLHLDVLRCDFAHRDKPAVLHDGWCHTGHGSVEVEGKDMAVFSTDDHAPYEHMGVLAACRNLLEVSEAETFINGGDACDWTSLCPHNKSKPLLAENLRLTEDIKAFVRILQAQTDSTFIKEKVLIDANHEWWIERYINEHSELVGLFDQKTLYGKYLAEWRTHVRRSGSDYTYYFRDLAVRHGDKESKIPGAAKLFDKYICGHYHAHHEHMRIGMAGTGNRLNPPYLENNITAWQNTITTITSYKGKAAYDIKSVLHTDKKQLSRFSWQGEIYEVKYHKY